MFNRIGVAVLGTGFIAGLHIDALRRLALNVRGALARDPSSVRGRYGHLYGSLAEVCDDRSVGAVHVTTPNHLHAAQVHELLAAGKHVVCEKPLALTVADGESVLAAARNASLLHAVCFNVRFYPLVHHLRDLIAAGELGEIHLVTGSYQQDWLLHRDDWNWRIDPARGGRLRAVADIGSHWLDLARFVTGADVREVLADLATVHPTRLMPAGSVSTFESAANRERHEVPVATEDTAGILLRFDNGARGTATISQVSAGRKNSCRLEVYGTRGSAAWDSEQPDQLWLGRRDRVNQVLLRDPALLSESARRISHYPGGHGEGFAETFLSLFDRIYTAVRIGTVPDQLSYPTFADGVQSLLVEDAVAASAVTGAWTTVDERTAP